VGFTQKEHEIYAAYTGDADFASKIGNHSSGSSYSGFTPGKSGPVAGKPDHVADDFGVVWNRSVDKDIGVIEDFVLKEPDLAAFNPPPIYEDIIRAGYEKIFNKRGAGDGAGGDASDGGNDSTGAGGSARGGGNVNTGAEDGAGGGGSPELADDETFKHGSVGFSMFERAWTLRGMEHFLIDMLTEPDFAHGLLDAICEFNLKIVEIGLSYNVDGFYFGDDWGQQKGLIMGPELWRKYIKPRMARLYGAVKSKGKFVIQHSCGDITAIFSDLIEIGLDCYQTFQPEIYDIRAVKREYGRDLSFWGGISTQRLLPFASPAEVKDKTVEIMRIMGKGGGYLAAPTHAIPGDVPPENVEAMLEVFQNQDRYL
jgi:uroporphyrinogen decarboxylase